jgi:hypothetical protein
MRFVGPVHQGQIWGKATPIRELDWMLKRVDFLVSRQLQADSFYSLEVTLIPVVGDRLLVAKFKDRDRLYDHEKVPIVIPETVQGPWFSPRGEEIKVTSLHRSGCDQGLFCMLGGRLD